MEDFIDPDLPPIEGSEIEAAVDVAFRGPDNVSRPIYINQDKELLQLSLEDARRLHKFLSSAIRFVEEFERRTIQ